MFSSQQSSSASRNSGAAYSFSRHELIDQLQATMSAVGMPYTGKHPFRTDGSVNRWHDNGRRGGPLWYIANELTDGHLAAVFGDWRVASRCEFRSWQKADDIPPEAARFTKGL